MCRTICSVDWNRFLFLFFGSRCRRQHNLHQCVWKLVEIPSRKQKILRKKWEENVGSFLRFTWKTNCIQIIHTMNVKRTNNLIEAFFFLLFLLLFLEPNYYFRQSQHLRYTHSTHTRLYDDTNKQNHTLLLCAKWTNAWSVDVVDVGIVVVIVRKHELKFIANRRPNSRSWQSLFASFCIL